jgi:tetratricopeptide (TPR) repeat protein
MKCAIPILACVLLGCQDIVKAGHEHAYALAQKYGGVDETSLTIPVSAPAGYAQSTANPLALRGLLRQGEFATLDSLLTAAADSAHRDYRNESSLYAAYDAFASDTSLAGPLDRWVAARPTSAPARIARASYLVDQGWSARGTAYARYTSRSAMQRMRELFDKAIGDLDSAIALTPNAAAAYRLRIQIAKVTSNQKSARQDLIDGLKDIPASYVLRRQYMSDLIPRWGGSYDAMRAMAAWSREMADSNPRLRALAGFVALDSAEMLEINGHRAEALALYDSALTYGDEAMFHLERGQCLLRMKNYAAALPDLDSAVAMAPTDSKTYLWRGSARLGLRRSHPELSRAALIDFQHALLLDPSDNLASSEFMLLYTVAH